MLPRNIEYNGKLYPIRDGGHYETILDILIAFDDPELSRNEALTVALRIFYPEEMPNDIEAAVSKMYEFIDAGLHNDSSCSLRKKLLPMMNWSKDLPLIIAAMNKMLGYDIREKEFFHWHTFIYYYLELPESTFSFVTNIRYKLTNHVKLSDSEKEFYNNNIDTVVINRLSKEDNDFLLSDW